MLLSVATTEFASAKNWRTVVGFTSRMALSSRSTTALSNSSDSRFSGG
jgi:hypothetical protein